MSVDRYQLINSPKKDELPKTAEELRQEKESEIETLRQQTLHLILDFRMDYVEHHLKELQQQISLSVNEPDKLMKLMAEFKEMQQIRNALAKKLGNDIIV